MAAIQKVTLLSAFLDLIALSEGTSSHPLTKTDGYDVIVSGVDGLHIFSDFARHPFADGRAPIVVRTEPQLLRSTAAGRYQFIVHTWQQLSTQLQLTDFLPVSQDMAALLLLRENGARARILAGDVAGAIVNCADTWASFPGNLFQQGGHTFEWLIANYARLKRSDPA